MTNERTADRKLNALQAAIRPLFEGLEVRSHFSATPTANLGGPYTVAEGQSIQISGLTSSDSDGTVATYQWDTNYSVSKGFKNRLGGGTWTFAADNSGTRTIALRVVDNNGDTSAVQTATINITDVAPTITLTAPNTANEASPVSISWSYTDPSAVDVVTAWDVDWGDGSTSTYAGSASGASHTYDEDGSYVMTLTATQADGQTDVTHNITVANVPAIIVATAPATTIDEGEMVQMDFTSPNRGGTLDGWTIDWGDGVTELFTASRSHAAHQYTDSGTYAAVITAMEPDGGSSSETVTYTVNNVAPTVAITGTPGTGTEGTSITVGSTVTDAGIDDTQTYGWTVYRNGTHFVLPGGTTLNGQSFTFTPTDNGSYVVRLSVMDDEGAITTINSSAIVVGNVAPTANITGTPQTAIDEGTVVNLTATPADAGTEDTFTYAWSVTKGGVAYPLPNGTDVSHAAFSFTPADNGVYIASVTVTDDDGGHVTVATSSFSVDNVAPTASINAPTTADEGDTVNATSTVVDPGTADTQSYAWTVEKLTAGGNGTLTTDANGRGEFNSFDWGSAFTIATRVSINSTMGDGTSHILHTPFDPGFDLSVTIAGGDTSVSLTDANGNSITTPLNAVTADTFFDLAVSYDGTTGDAAIYVNGVSVITGTLDTGLGGSEHTHFAEGFIGTFDNFTFYRSSLSAQDVADLYNDFPIVTTPAEQWNFDENAGSTLAVSPFGKSFSTSGYATFSGASTWVSYTLPGDSVTDEANFAFVPTDNGTYRLKLTVTDDDTGTVNTTSSDIVVANVAPTATLTAPTTGTEGSALNFSVARADAGSDDTHTYLWTVSKDGNNYDLNGATDNTAAFAFTPDDNGSYEISVVVTDNDGDSVTKTTTINVLNANPVVSLTGVPTTGLEGQSISVGSTVTDAGVNDGFDYAWSVTKDSEAVDLTGITTTNSSFAFTPEDNGSYVLTLLVTDNDGGTRTVNSAAIVVANVNPTGTIGGEPVAPMGEGGQVDLYSTPADDGVADTFTYVWTITKDGHAWTPLSGTTLNDSDLSFVPTDNGTYIATVVITDKDNGSVSVDSQPILIGNSDPSASITDAPANSPEGTALELGSSVLDDGAADTFTYAWTVTKDGDPVDLTGIADDEASFSYTPRDNGTYVIGLTVVDDDGGATNTSATVTVTNANPVPTIAGNSSVNEGSAITVTATPHDPGVDDTHTYSWSVTRNGSAYNTNLGATNAAAFTFTPNLHGTYIASVVVTDNNGGTATVTKTITVNDVAPTVAITGTPSGPRGEGSPLTFGSTVTDVSGETGLTYAWSVKRGGVTFALPNTVVTTGTTFEFEPTDNGSYRVTLAVTDSGGLTTTATTSNITVTNALPDASITGTPVSPVAEGSAITLTVDAADPGSEDVLSYAWSVTKNGQTFTLPNGTVTNATTFTFTPTDQGTYAARVVVTDDDNGPATVTTSNITITNVAPTVVINDAPSTSLNEGTIISLTATGTDPGSADTLTYSWSVTKDGDPFGSATAPSVNSGFNFRPTDNGSYVVSVVINDGLATQTTSTAAIVIDNVSPTGSVSGPAASKEGEAVTITATATDAGSADTLTYAWSVTKDGDTVTLPDGMVTNTESFTYMPTDQGEYEFSCVVIDDDGTDVTLTHDLTVTNVNPTIGQTNVPETGTEGAAITVGGTASDPGDDTLTYGWTVYRDGDLYTLADGTVLDGETFTFTPTDNGSYVIRLSVMDEDGGIKSMNSDAITVGNAAPVASIAESENVDEGTEATLTATVTDAGEEDTEAGFTYAWSAKRGNATVATSDEAEFSFTPTVHGTYTIRLVVTDKDGTSTTTNSSIVVDNRSPDRAGIEGSLEDLTEGDNVSLSAYANDAEDDTLGYSWQVFRGDNVFTSGTGSDINFTAARGNYEIVVTATDTAGASDTVSQDFHVDNAAPEAVLTGPTDTVLIGTQATFGLTIDDVPANQPFTAEWDFGDGSTATVDYFGDTQAVRKHVYATAGTYMVTASIDDGADITVVTTTVNVTNAYVTPDPTDSSKTALIVLGTDGNDVINVTQNTNGRYTVNFNNTVVGTAYRPTGRIYVYGNGGSNTINVSGTNNAFVFAGTGAANVTTGAGNDVIVGSAGVDRLNGGDGRDLIIGGLGADILRGGDGEDLVIAGNLKSLDANSLKSAADKWTTSQDTATRRKNLTSLFGKQLINDSGSNQLYGESKNDWFLANTQVDRLRDLQKTDLVN